MGDHDINEGGTLDWGSEMKVSLGVTNGEVFHSILVTFNIYIVLYKGCKCCRKKSRNVL